MPVCYCFHDICFSFCNPKIFFGPADGNENSPGFVIGLLQAPGHNSWTLESSPGHDFRRMSNCLIVLLLPVCRFLGMILFLAMIEAHELFYLYFICDICDLNLHFTCYLHFICIWRYLNVHFACYVHFICIWRHP